MLDCWFVQEKAGRGGGLTAPTSQEKSLLLIRKDAHSHSAEPQVTPSDINPERVYFVTGEFNLPVVRMCITTFI